VASLKALRRGQHDIRRLIAELEAESEVEWTSMAIAEFQRLVTMLDFLHVLLERRLLKLDDWHGLLIHLLFDYVGEYERAEARRLEQQARR